MKKKIVLSFFALLALLAVNFFLWGDSDRVFFTAVSAFSVLLIAALLSRFHKLNSAMARNAAKSADKAFSQTQSLLFVYGKINFKKPLPPMRGSAISPDFAAILISLFEERAPKTTLECGSGISTIILSYLAEKNNGRVISLDHLEEFADSTREELKKHRNRSEVKVVLAELKKRAINGQSYNWYDLDKIENITTPIDMLIIDGPPKNSSKNARYPALPLLRKKLSDNCVIVLDDADRADERETVEKWLKEFPEFKKTYIPTEKGTVVLEIKK